MLFVIMGQEMFRDAIVAYENLEKLDFSNKLEIIKVTYGSTINKDEVMVQIGINIALYFIKKLKKILQILNYKNVSRKS